MALQDGDLLAVYRETDKKNYKTTVAQLFTRAPSPVAPGLTAVLDQNNTSQNVDIIIDNNAGDEQVKLSASVASSFTNGLSSAGDITVSSGLKLTTAAKIQGSACQLVGDLTNNALLVYPSGTTIDDLSADPTVTVTNAGAATFAGALEALSIDGGIYAETVIMPDGWNPVNFENLGVLINNGEWEALVYGNNVLVAMSGFGPGPHALYSTDLGLTWTATDLPLPQGTDTFKNTYVNTVYAQNQFVCVTQTTSPSTPDEPEIVTSTNGIDWTGTFSTALEHKIWYDIAFGGGKYVIVGVGGNDANKSGTQAAYSVDGINWTLTTVPLDCGWYSVCYGNGQFVAATGIGSESNNETNLVMTSPNGIDWTLQTTPTVDNASWDSIVYGNGVYVAVGPRGTNRVMYSSNGVNWTLGNAAAQNNWISVTFAGGKFVAVSSKHNTPYYPNESEDLIMTSENGIDWVMVPDTSFSNNFRDVIYAKDRFIAVSNQTPQIAWSYTGN